MKNIRTIGLVASISAIFAKDFNCVDPTISEKRDRRKAKRNHADLFCTSMSSLKRRYRNNARGYGKNVAEVRTERLDTKNQRRASNGLAELKTYAQV